MKLNNKRAQALLAAAFFSILLIACVWLGSGNQTEDGTTIPISESSAPNPTSGRLVVVIDPGHGGNDPGAHGIAHGERVFEAPYVADVSLRLAKRLQKMGVITVLTRHNKRVGIMNNHPWKILPLTGEHDRFQSGAPVHAKSSGMNERIATYRKAVRDHPGSRVIFVAIHFDSEGRPDLRGAFVVVPSKVPSTARAIAHEFKRAHRSREQLEDGVWRPYVPISPNIRNLYILRNDKNPAREKMLVELGNFQNQGDLFRIRYPKVREDYASEIAQAIITSAAR